MCNFSMAVQQVPIDLGYNTFALLDRLIVLNRFMMGPGKPKWVLISGSLLSAYRHGQIMPWDIDTDIMAEQPRQFVEYLITELKAADLAYKYSIIRKPDGVYTWKLAKPCIEERHAFFHMDIHPLGYYRRQHTGTLDWRELFRSGICTCSLNHVLLQCPRYAQTVSFLQSIFGKDGRNYMKIDKSKYEQEAIDQVEELDQCLYPVQPIAPTNWSKILKRLEDAKPKPKKPAAIWTKTGPPDDGREKSRPRLNQRPSGS